MLRLVSIETGLEDIKSHLNDCGYQVVDMAENLRPVEAVIYMGAPTNSSVAAKAARGTAVINAAGLTAEQVASCLDERL
ncbi:YkuS family protein [Dendrosporobacter sp. 1207_IL3150]|uniref:YkuS family protein n=1 Tax=Dendrosporobacter sp. 1207_IL3150 TaxID=3084054 RepID=UPI002FD8E77F